MAVASCCWMLRVVTAYVPRLGHRESICTSRDVSERAAECSFVRRYLTWLTFVAQRLSVAVQLSVAQEAAEALGLSVAADPRAR